MPDRPFGTRRHRLFALLARYAPRLAGSDRLIRFGVERLARTRERRLDHAALRDLGFAGRPRTFYDHHRCHAAAAYYASGFAERHARTLVITYDGSGDGLCASISVVDSGGWRRLHTINSYHSLGLLYSRITLLLGMKPLEDEYKVMGMAPYADPKRGAAVRDILRGYVRLTDDGLSTINVSRSWGASMVAKLAHDLRGQRFDWIARGVQVHFEEVMLGLVLGWVRQTGVRAVVLGGGAFMNVKLNMLLAQHEEIEDLYVLPSCGDESIALGAAYLANEAAAPGTSQPLGPLYLGPESGEDEVQAALARYGGQVAYRRCQDIERTVAELLAEHRIVARCRGRMEWGARALGNRSILANPTRTTAIHRINRAIKMRDFWMPFCPSILDTHAPDYLLNPRCAPAPYMILAFDSTPLAHEHLAAALHPFDQTCRPQVVTEGLNPRFHALLRHFQQLTGVGGVLNTSFNLHGEPIVATAEDCLYTLVHSDLDYLALEDYLVWRAA
ncbi:MAG: hypothetical protein HYU88_06995 [Chloroflexi bacterium]|nr:hypothetical protein [Chloroflexota bacterium]